MSNGRKLETEGPFAGLWVRVARALHKAGYRNRDEVRADIESGALRPFLSVHDYGKYADRDTRSWLGLPTWEEQWGKVAPSARTLSVKSVKLKRRSDR